MQIKDELQEESNIEFDGASSDTASKKGGVYAISIDGCFICTYFVGRGA